MALIGASIPVGATFAPTGGTARTLVDLGQDGSARKLLVDDTSAYNVRKYMVASTSENATTVKRRISIKKYKTLADGSSYQMQFNIELVIPPEATQAEVTDLKSTGSCAINDADFDTFWNAGGTS